MINLLKLKKLFVIVFQSKYVEVKQAGRQAQAIKLFNQLNDDTGQLNKSYFEYALS